MNVARSSRRLPFANPPDASGSGEGHDRHPIPTSGVLRGFTLLEVLLAVVVFAVVLGAIHTVYFGALQLRNKTTATLDNARPLEQTLAVLKRDLANIVPPGTLLAGPLQTTPTSQTPTQSQGGTTLTSSSTAFGAAPGLASGLQSPTWYTASGIIRDSQPWGEIQRVMYHLADPTNQTTGKDLVRTVTRNLLPVLQDQPEDQWLMGGLETMTFHFYDGTTWRDTWDSTAESTPLPRAIRVELQLASQPGDRDPPAPIDLVVPILVQAATNSTSATTEAMP